MEEEAAIWTATFTLHATAQLATQVKTLLLSDSVKTSQLVYMYNKYMYRLTLNACFLIMP